MTEVSLGNSFMENPQAEAQGVMGVTSTPFEGQEPFGFTQMVGRSLARAAIPVLTPAPGGNISADQANKQYGIKDAEGTDVLKFDNEVDPGLANYMRETKLEELQRQATAERAPQTFWGQAARMGAGLVTSFTDPVNLAAGIIPVGPVARVAEGAIAKYGAESLMNRAAIRSAEGMVSAGAAQVPLTAATALMSNQEQTSYGVGDAMRDIAFGSILGGGMHATFGLADDALDNIWRGSVQAKMAAANQDVREGALKTSIAQMIDGRPIEVQPVFDAANYKNSLLTGSAFDRVQATQGRYEVNPPLAHENMTRAMDAVAGKPEAAHEAVSAEADQAVTEQARTVEANLGKVSDDIADLERLEQQHRAAGRIDPETENELQASKDEAKRIEETNNALLEHTQTEGDQTVIPGAEKIGDKQLAERQMEGGSKSGVAQKPADDGLFDVAGRGQADMFAGKTTKRGGLKGPTDMFQYIAKLGGIKDTGGELKAMDLDKVNSPFHGKLVKETGKNPDDILRSLRSAGYLPDDSTIADLYEAMRSHNVGQKIYAAEDMTEGLARGQKKQAAAQDDEFNHYKDSMQQYSDQNKLPLTKEQLDYAATLLSRGSTEADALDTARGMIPEGEEIPFQRTNNAPAEEGSQATPITDKVSGIESNRSDEKTIQLQQKIEDIINRIAPGSRLRFFEKLEAKGEGKFSRSVEIGGVFLDKNSKDFENVLGVSLSAPDPMHTAIHEALHSLYRNGFFSDKEWKVLTDAAKKEDWIGKYDIDTRYAGGTPELKTEEAIAERVGDYLSAREEQRAQRFSSLPKPMKVILDRIADFFTQIKAAIKDAFGANVTADEVIQRIQSGYVGKVGAAETTQAHAEEAFQRNIQEGNKAVDDRAQRLMAQDPTLGRAEALSQAVKQITDQNNLAAAMKRREALLNMQARTERLARIEAEGPKKLVDGIMAEIHGINTPRAGGRFSAEAEWHTLHRQYVEGLTVDLERAGLFEAARGGLLQKETAIEMGELNKEDGKSGITKNKEAQMMAQIFNKYLTLAKENLNKAGTQIGDYIGYVAHTAHDPDLIRRAGYETWRDVTLKNLDTARTFEGVQDPERFMQHVYNSFITGVHLTEKSMDGFKVPFNGPGNLARRLSEERILHWKDAESWLDYQKQFGNGNLTAAVRAALERSARSTSLLRRWGTNPRLEFDADIRRLQEKYRDIDPDAVNKLGAARNSLQNRFDFLDGTANMPQNRLAAKISAGIRLDEAMSKLGSVLFTHLSVGMTRAAEFRHHGVGFLESYGDFVGSLARGRGTGEMRDVMDSLGAGAEMASHDIAMRFMPDDTIPGTLSKLANVFFKWTGLSYVYNAERSGFEAMLSHNLGRNADAKFENLHPGLRNLLKSYDITPDHWDLIRAAEHEQANGRTYVTPKSAANIDPKAAEKYLLKIGKLVPSDAPEVIARRVDGLKQELATKLGAYFVDSSERGMIMPGVQDRAILLQGTRPGTITGESLRFLSQFKLWPTALITKGIGRELYTSPTKASAALGLFHMAVAGTAFGYLRMVANDLTAGRNPRDPADPKVWLAAMQQGGGIGILGDFLFGEYNRFGQGPLVSMMGPAAGDVNTLYDLYNRAKEGKDLSAESFKFVVDHTPFVNMFYTRAALNYLFLWHVQEAMNPGWARRYEQSMKQKNNQTMWLRPTQAVGH